MMYRHCRFLCSFVLVVVAVGRWSKDEVWEYGYEMVNRQEQQREG